MIDTEIKSKVETYREDKNYSVQLVKFSSFKKVEIGAKKLPGFVLSYTRLDSEIPTKGSVQYLAGPRTDAERAVLTNLEPEVTELVLVKEKKPNPADPNKPYWNLVEFLHKDEWRDRPVSTTFFSKKEGGSDNLGAQVGNALKLSVETLGSGKTLAQYKTRALEFIILGDELKIEITARRANTTHTTGVVASTEANLAAENHNQATQREEETTSTSVPF